MIAEKNVLWARVCNPYADSVVPGSFWFRKELKQRENNREVKVAVTKIIDCWFPFSPAVVSATLRKSE